MSAHTTSDSLFEFLAKLDKNKLSYRLDRVREGTVMVVLALPGQIWEVEFFDDGHIEVERFLSDGTISDASVLSELWTTWSK